MMSTPARILFQGDSVTDAGRSREDDAVLGYGYPTLVSAQLGLAKPGQYEFLNRAVSGNRIVDLYARWKIDCLNMEPDAVSILIGINDVWHELAYRNGVEADRFETVYDMLLAFTRERLPHTRLMLLEPFVLRAAATDADWDAFRCETALRADAVRRLAEKYAARFVPLQGAFDEACKRAPASYWLRDGVHPTAAGHQLICEKWIGAFLKP